MGGSKISIRENLELINERIAAASAKAGRRDDIQLIAVTKTIDLERIREAIEAGATDIGENKAQELSDKMNSLGTTCLLLVPLSLKLSFQFFRGNLLTNSPLLQHHYH